MVLIEAFPQTTLPISKYFGSKKERKPEFYYPRDTEQNLARSVPGGGI
jgi:hypothetical protein